LICGVATKKPWLRQECGWILYNCSQQSLTSADTQDWALDILEKLNEHKIIRTPEGVALWIEISSRFPHAKLPTHAWKHGDPLAAKDIQMLGNILKDVPTQAAEEEGFESQGSAGWKAQLHFAWDPVLAELYKAESSSGMANRKQNKSDKQRVSFETFWLTAVDGGLFDRSTSPERKKWGLLVLEKALQTSPPELVATVLSPNALHCVINALKSDERYLKKSAKKVVELVRPALERLRGHAAAEPLAAACIEVLLKVVDLGDFDQITRTKSFEDLSNSSQDHVCAALHITGEELLHDPDAKDSKDADIKRRKVLNFQARMFAHMLPKAGDRYSDNRFKRALEILIVWVDIAYFEVTEVFKPELAPETRDYIRERLALCFEQGLRQGVQGSELLREAISHIRSNEKAHVPQTVQFEEEVGDIVKKAWKQLNKLSSGPKEGPKDSTKVKKSKGKSGDAMENGTSTGTKQPPNAFTEGLMLLYSLVLFTIYNGEPDAVEMLEDLIAYHDSLDLKSDNAEAGEESGIDTLVLILRNFASKPSKFLRRITLQVFEALASQITAEGLEPLVRVLQCSEDARGLQKLSSMEGGEELDGTDDGTDAESGDAEDSDVEMDSDVEVLSANDEEDGDTSESSSEAGDTIEDASSDDDDDGDDENNAAQNALEVALAAALGTHKAPEDSDAADTSDSDSDMDDDQMMELDDKLTQVFREQQNNTSAKKSLQKDQKDAKETMINLKNRVLDFLDVYLKSSPLDPVAVSLIVPLLRTVRTATTKQVVDHAFQVLRDYWQRTKGWNNVPSVLVDSEDAATHLTTLLLDVHDEACLQSSNAHAAACSQASILLVKVMLNSGANVAVPVGVYADTRVRQLTDKDCAVQPGFFTAWQNWCVGAREKLVQAR